MEEFYKQEIEHLKELASDPTLESCCRRDLEDAIKVAKVKAELTPQDKSQARQRLAAKVYGSEPIHVEEEEESDSEELVKINSPLTTEALRALRLQELESQARAKSMLLSQGQGTVTTVNSPATLDTSIADTVVDYIVIHFPVEGDAQGEILDETLELLARQYLGTRFIRCPVSPTSNIPRRFGISPSAGPSLVVLYQSTIIAASSISDIEECNEEDEDVEDAVERWLVRYKVLLVMHAKDPRSLHSPRDNNNGTRKEDSENDNVNDNDDTDREGDDEWRKPCEECGRRYHHQHIRSMQASTLEKYEDEDYD